MVLGFLSFDTKCYFSFKQAKRNFSSRGGHLFGLANLFFLKICFSCGVGSIISTGILFIASVTANRYFPTVHCREYILYFFQHIMLSVILSLTSVKVAHLLFSNICKASIFLCDN